MLDMDPITEQIVDIEDTETHPLLLDAANYLSQKIAAVQQRSPELEHAMKLSSAQLQQDIAAFILDNYPQETELIDSQDIPLRRELRDRVQEFWGRYSMLVQRPLLERGVIKKLEPNTSLVQVRELQHGVIGTIATAIMLRRSGDLRYAFASPTDDVDKGIDMIASEKGTRRNVNLQIKCRQPRFDIGYSGSTSMVHIEMPNVRSFYEDYALGIPHRSQHEEITTPFYSTIRGNLK